MKKRIKEFKELYKELMSFKDKEDFKYYGFSQGYKYHAWLMNLIEFQKNYGKKLSLSGVMVNDLLQLAIEYVKTRGEENIETEHYRKFLNSIY